MAAEQDEQQVQLYALEDVIALGIPRIRVEADALSMGRARGTYLIGYQHEGYDVITRIADELQEGESVMGLVNPGDVRYRPLERVLEQYEDMRGHEPEIREIGDGMGYLMLADDTAVKGPLDKLEECVHRGSRFHLDYGYTCTFTKEGAVSLGLTAQSKFSGREHVSERHGYELVLPIESAASGKKPKSRGYRAKMHEYRSSLSKEQLSHRSRGLLERIVDTLLGDSMQDEKRVWFWEDRVNQLEDMLGGAGSDEDVRDALLELKFVLKKHYYLRKKHPELWARICGLLSTHTCAPRRQTLREE